MVWLGRIAWEEGKMVGRLPTLGSPATVTAFSGVYGTVTPFGGDWKQKGENIWWSQFAGWLSVTSLSTRSPWSKTGRLMDFIWRVRAERTDNSDLDVNWITEYAGSGIISKVMPLQSRLRGKFKKRLVTMVYRGDGICFVSFKEYKKLSHSFLGVLVYVRSLS